MLYDIDDFDSTIFQEDFIEFGVNGHWFTGNNNQLGMVSFYFD